MVHVVYRPIQVTINLTGFLRIVTSKEFNRIRSIFVEQNMVNHEGEYVTTLECKPFQECNSVDWAM